MQKVNYQLTLVR